MLLLKWCVAPQQVLMVHCNPPFVVMIALFSCKDLEGSCANVALVETFQGTMIY
jgi:hypothetical protein